MSFPEEYYSTLCQSYALEKFYAENATITMKEELNEKQTKTEVNEGSFGKEGLVEKLLAIHGKKKVIKVLISSIDIQNIAIPQKDSDPENSTKLYTILGQFVYHDNTTHRFSHIFIKQEFITNEILTILDEEIVYKHVNLSSKVKNMVNTIRVKRNTTNLNSNLCRNKILNEFSYFGNLIAVQNDNNDFLLEYENEENIKSINLELNNLRQRGYRIEFCG